MANTTIQLKRSSVAGKQPNTSTLSVGELAINLTDKKLYSSDGSSIFEPAANVTNLNVTANATISAIVANGSLGTSGQTLTSNGSTIYWSTATGSGTVTSVATSNGLTGGPITSSGTISVLANNGITSNSSGVFVTQGTGTVVNATGVHVNSTYIGTLSANSATYLGGNTASDLRSYSDTVAGTAYSNATSYASNASNLSSGTVPSTRISGSYTGITGVGTITAGTWQGSSISTTYTDAKVTSVTGGNGLTGGTTGAVTLAVGAGNGITVAADSVSVIANNGLSANATGVYVVAGNGLAASNSTGVHVGAGSGITVNSTAVAVLANTGIVANATGTFVNATYIGTISANNASFLGGTAAASYVQNTDSRTLSGNLTFTGVNVNFNSSTLGGTATNFANNIILYNSVGNASYLRFYVYRHTTGADWTGASTRIQQRIDSTNQGYIEFNPSGYTYGVGIYGSSGAGITVSQTGNVAISNTFTVGTSAYFVANGNGLHTWFAGGHGG